MYNSVIEKLFRHNREQSALFCSVEAKQARQAYRSVHTTKIGATECMDERVDFAEITQTPTGIIQLFDNIGGKFDFGCGFCEMTLNDLVRYAGNHGRDVIFLATYHWSAGDSLRGCAGFKYDTAAAMRHTVEICAQIRRMYKNSEKALVYPIQVGIETDTDTLYFHGRDGKILRTNGQIPEGLREQQRLVGYLADVFPDLPNHMATDLVPLFIGNERHVVQLQLSPRPTHELMHAGQAIIIGEATDWLRDINTAFRIGPFGYDRRPAIKVAASMVLDVLQKDKVADGTKHKEGAALLASAGYKEEGDPTAKDRAIEKAKATLNFALEVIREEVPDLIDHLQAVAGVTSFDTRLFTPIL